MTYIITSNGDAPGYNIAREYIGDYRARDFIAPVVRVYGGRIVPTCPLTFDSEEEARGYMERRDITDWQIVRYDPCLNSIIS